jgi:hypothetical protein
MALVLNESTKSDGGEKRCLRKKNGKRKKRKKNGKRKSGKKNQVPHKHFSIFLLPKFKQYLRLFKTVYL